MLNGPRTVPYNFKVFEFDGVVWLFDDSSRTYICSDNPTIFAEPIYWVDGECDEVLPDPDYFGDSVAADAVPIHNGSFASDVSETEAWDEARESACANCVI